MNSIFNCVTQILHVKVGPWSLFRASERIGGKEQAIFFTNLAYISHIRQNHRTFLHSSTKINVRNAIFTKVSRFLNYHFFIF